MDYNIDMNELRRDLEIHYGSEMVTFSGVLGFSDMMSIDSLSDAEIVQQAIEQGFNLDKYRL
ncbi:hypothetical protein [Pseudobutyrivibrio xylanivorans]|uniref:Uncharacterized protein n=1 Tax=Pseudobutyrivibrio xylanivorans TaxID=185007 RepID=A0A5P6VU33_PSEXY|nr:hypothetical protein [Pseudobutyrivibrio xylanivorans]QFJ55259.1 hypothetical protein FXF36_10490 [Pseudobutyrivibrio xylanivorans]